MSNSFIELVNASVMPKRFLELPRNSISHKYISDTFVSEAMYWRALTLGDMITESEIYTHHSKLLNIITQLLYLLATFSCTK